MNITSGSRTYRIPSPTRGHTQISRSAFQQPEHAAGPADVGSLDADPNSTKGFYISFDNEQPKPPLRTKKGIGGSPKKERSYIEDEENKEAQERAAQDKLERKRQLERELESERLKMEAEDIRRREADRVRREAVASHNSEIEKVNAASAIIIGNDLTSTDPVSLFLF